MAARMMGEQAEKLSSGYLSTMNVLYDEIKKMEKHLEADRERLEEFYEGVMDGRKEVYDSAKRMLDAEPSKDNTLRMKWAGALCAMVATGKAGCTGPATRESLIDIMKWKFGMDDEAALDALEAASYTGVIREDEGAYKLK